MAPNIKIILYGSKYSDLYYSNKKSPARVIFFRFDTHFPKLLLCYVNRLAVVDGWGHWNCYKCELHPFVRPKYIECM